MSTDRYLRLSTQLVLLAVTLSWLACVTPKPDIDGQPGQARSLLLDTAIGDALNCGDRRQPDCADWYLVHVPERGHLSFEVRANDAPGPTDFSVVATDHRGDPIARRAGQGRDAVTLRMPAEPGAYLVAVESEPSSRPLGYQLVARFEPLPPPPPPPVREPEFVTTSWRVLEVESDQGRQRAVILDGGMGQGLRTGLRGRLVEDEQPIAEVEIVEVFEEGSRAEIRSELRSAITAATQAEIDVPTGEVPGSSP